MIKIMKYGDVPSKNIFAAYSFSPPLKAGNMLRGMESKSKIMVLLYWSGTKIRKKSYI